MKRKLQVLSVFFLFTSLSHFSFSQDSNDPRWNVDPRTVVNLSGDYKPLPTVQNDIIQFTTEPQKTITPMGIMVTYPNVRVRPGNGFSQSETPIVSSPINRNILFGSSNAYTFSTGQINSGVYVSLDGGLTWSGADNFGAGSSLNQRGDPGPVISKFGTFLFTHLTSASNFGSVTGMGANRSVDNGATWTNTFQVVNDGGADKNLTASDDYPSSPFYGNSYFAWTSFSTSPANGRASRTINDGVSWSAQITINTTPAGHNAQGHDVATGPNGDVYIVWTAGVNASPFTEDFVGFAKSVNGGVSYTATENAFDVNGSRSGSFNGWAIRTNGFPRIAVDKTGGVRNGWIYVVSSEINHAPAGSDADVVFHRSTNGGTTWSGGIRVNQDALNNGKVQFFPAICVDSDGGLNVVYYDNRQFPSVGDSCTVYISRSLDGGTTWADVKVADHNFRPKQMTPFGGGYMGDYIGIAASEGKVVALWMDDKANTAGIPNAWAGALDISQTTICQDFSSATFPPSDMSLEFTGTQYWARFAQSAYASGVGSARFNSWSATSGTVQSLVSDKFLPVPANTYLTFDEAYAGWSGGTADNCDSLVIETSTSGGTTFSTLIRLWGGNTAFAGPLNTAPAGGQFTPTAGQWRPKLYLLPVGTDKIRLKAISRFGNDIWIDNVCLQTLPAPIANSIGLILEGMFIPTDPYNRLADTVEVYLHRSDLPSVVVDSARSTLGGNAVVDNLFFNNALSGNYYRVVKHRNCIETWSNAGVLYARGSASHHNFVPNGNSFGNNMAIVGPSYRAMFSGDLNQDGIIDGSDVSIIDNDAANFVTGYVVSDVTGDLVSDGSDFAIIDNNAANSVVVIRPPGASPMPAPFEDSNPVFKTEEERQKYELTKKISADQFSSDQSDNKTLTYKEFLKSKFGTEWDDSIVKEANKTKMNTSNTGDQSHGRVGEK